MQRLTILTRSLVRMRMPLQAFRASIHLAYDSLVLHRQGHSMSLGFPLAMHSFHQKGRLQDRMVLSYTSEMPCTAVGQIIQSKAMHRRRIDTRQSTVLHIRRAIRTRCGDMYRMTCLKTSSRERAKLVRLNASFASTVSDGQDDGMMTLCCNIRSAELVLPSVIFYPGIGPQKSQYIYTWRGFQSVTTICYTQYYSTHYVSPYAELSQRSRSAISKRCFASHVR